MHHDLRRDNQRNAVALACNMFSCYVSFHFFLFTHCIVNYYISFVHAQVSQAKYIATRYF